LILGITLCDFQTLLRTAQLEIVAHHFSRDADLSAVDTRFSGLHEC
jgi:hypothetical protein